MNFKLNVQSNTLVDQVEESILEYIKRNKLVPGDTLPNEIELAGELGISRNVLREALSRLRMLGIVQSRTKRGIVIQEPPLLLGFEKVIGPWLLSEKTIVEMMGMRIIMEIGLTDFLFMNLTDEDIADLERIVHSQESMKHHMSIEQEDEFHEKIYKIAGNNFVVRFHKIIHPLFEFAKLNYDKYFATVNERLITEGKYVTHHTLFNYIKARDVEGYRNAIKIHLQTYLEFIRNKTRK